MEYLPEKKRTQKTQIAKKEQKIREFRQELVDNNVVLAIVKCKFIVFSEIISHRVISTDLVAMRSQQQLPEDPVAHFMDYIGNQRSPLWDDMEAMEDENTRIGEGIPGLESEIERLKQGLVDAQRKTKMIESYKQADPETTVSNR